MTEGQGVEESEIGFLVLDVVEVIRIDTSGTKGSPEAVIAIDTLPSSVTE
ncbi:hypothetical protein [Nitrosococcus watsonii]|uniref:Uncharacterized protein n=1 Tax=Nitrosococcus watsoni (strain C-113) TaxID=105559 RepID=D8K9C5_NITWC|nr:hypothetical protein [Nitrosococcus watsonii]ADJ29268.1 hypothetical protein Nwat_2466 [Nitrosococcus watsonii C-113]